MRKVIAYTLMLLIGLVAYGQNQSDSVRVYFRVNKSLFDNKLGENVTSMDLFIENISKAAGTDRLDHIVIYGYASPDGPEEFNERLAKKRCEAIADYISDRTGISRDLITTEAGGEAWEELRKMVADSDQIPDRELVLELLDNKELIEQSGGMKRKNQLKALDNGKPYRWMLTNIFPDLRYALAVSFYKPELKEEAKEDKDSIPTIAEIIELSERQESMPTDSVISADESWAIEDISEYSSELQTIKEEQPRHLLALKTNLLYYLALMPNLELEWLIRDNWSVAVEGNVAWWGSYAKERSYRVALFDAEARYWIKPRAPWHGFYVGVFAGGGWYDLEKGKGYYGDGGMTGLSLGYMWPIKRTLSLEAGIGAGYAYTRYKEYIPFEGHHIYQRTKEINYFGPLKLKLSLVWRFLDRNKTPKSKSVLNEN